MQRITRLGSSWIAAFALLAGCHVTINTDDGADPADAGTPPVHEADAGNPTPPGTTPCGTASCGADETCCSASCGLCEPKGGACPAIACVEQDAGAPAPSCVAALCPEDAYCDDSSGSAECKQLPSCKTVKCTADTTCELVTVECIRAPCPPLPQCVSNKPQPCELACALGTHCVVTSNGPACAQDTPGVSCGTKTCQADQVCCSQSCGICGSAGGACPAIACAPEI